jgi:cellulose synthase/poly-beta-1,6-N-acetylglucosamine synthase-like glycosyltransferase
VESYIRYTLVLTFADSFLFSEAFEYQMSNNLQKATEHVLGFISVLPGAFSAYRFSAIYSDRPGADCPLKYYFKSISTPLSELAPFEANVSTVYSSCSSVYIF